MSCMQIMSLHCNAFICTYTVTDVEVDRWMKNILWSQQKQNLTVRKPIYHSMQQDSLNDWDNFTNWKTTTKKPCFIYLWIYFYASVPAIAVARSILFLGHPSVMFSWTQYLNNTLRNFLQLWHKHPLGLRDKIRGSKVTVTVHPSHSCECHISKRLWKNFLKFGTNVYLDSRMNQLDFRGQRSRSLWPH